MRALNDENFVCISGTISEDAKLSHELYGEEFYTATVMAPRLSGTMDHVPLTIPARAAERMPMAGDRVAVSGQLRSYNRHGEFGSHLALCVFVKAIGDMPEDELPQNYIAVSGYLCKPVIFRTTPFMREIGDMLIASNRSFNKSDYLPCIAWGRNARLASEIPVGSRVRVEGRVQSRRYQKTLFDGVVQDRTAYEISCSTIELI